MIRPLKCAFLLLAVILLCAFRWEIMFGDLDWAIVNRAIDEDYPTVSSISLGELKAILDTGSSVELVDVRSSEEYQVSHLPGAVLADTWQYDDLDKDSVIVVYCSVGLRSAKFAEQLQQKGFSRVHNLRGSLFMWANSGYLLHAGGKPVKRAHPYSKRWGALLNAELHSYETIIK